MGNAIYQDFWKWGPQYGCSEFEIKSAQTDTFSSHLGLAQSAGIPASQPFLISSGFASCRGVARKGQRAPIHTRIYAEIKLKAVKQGLVDELWIQITSIILYSTCYEYHIECTTKTPNNFVGKGLSGTRCDNFSLNSLICFLFPFMLLHLGVDGKQLSHHFQPINMWSPNPFYFQSGIHINLLQKHWHVP